MKRKLLPSFHLRGQSEDAHLSCHLLCNNHLQRVCVTGPRGGWGWPTNDAYYSYSVLLYFFVLTVSQSLVATTWGNLRWFMCLLPSSSSLNLAIMGPTSRVAAIMLSGKVRHEQFIILSLYHIKYRESHSVYHILICTYLYKFIDVTLHCLTWSDLSVVWVVVYKCEVPLLEPHLADGEGGGGREAGGGAPGGGELTLLQLTDQLLINRMSTFIFAVW